MSTVLTVKNLKILDLPLISFSLKVGECLAIFGESGVGKSVCLKSIADLIKPTGHIYFGSTECLDMSAPLWRKNIRYIAAETGWWADKVEDHFELGRPSTSRLKEFGLSSDIMDKSVASLSTGQKQRLGLLRGLADRPSVLLLDEPTASLDKDNKARIERVIQKALGEGAAVCLVTHEKEQAMRLASKSLTLTVDDIKQEAL